MKTGDEYTKLLVKDSPKLDNGKERHVTNRVWFALLILAFCCTLLGSYGCSSQGISVASNPGQVQGKDPIFTACSCNDPTGTVDPGKDKDVGCCTCEIDSADPTNARVTIGNAYPGYECQITFKIRNTDSQAVKITTVNVTAPPAIDISVDPILVGKTLQPGEETEGFINVYLNDSATEDTSYNFSLEETGE